jgi:hypothetical protein
MPVVGQCAPLRRQFCLSEIHPAFDQHSEPSVEWNDESGGGWRKKRLLDLQQSLDTLREMNWREFEERVGEA